MALTTLYGWNENLNNYIGVSLVFDPESKYQKYFSFLNVAPGVKREEGLRGYDFKSGINYKLSLNKLNEISIIINAYIRRQEKMVGPFSVMNDTSKSSFGGNGYKTLYFNYNSGEDERSKGVPGLFLVAKYGEKTISTMLPAPTALTFADMCKKIFELGINEEIKNYKPFTSQDRGSGFDSGDSSYQQKKSSSFSGGSGGKTAPSENYPSFSSESEDVPF